ncbi:MAG: serine hydrolase [Blastocatellia bacterium]|nr:serine hydrolase [Blastocatellia bacterium]MCX7752878.1 serine hydrolase [Blastocatellia bacterium]MDW8167934.1 serine hydrolase [Acidobacteriota bacterium]MDW8255959.1 serine hydrolase [Acidobacteriota bacterium]
MRRVILRREWRGIMGVIAMAMLLGKWPGDPSLMSGEPEAGLPTAQGAPVQISESESTLRAHVDRLFAAWDRSGSPGCAIGIIKDGQLIYARGYGMANLEHAIPITPQTVFDIGSTAKQFTAASIVLLEQQGKLSLDDDIRKFVPEIPDYGRPITIRHLLHHTSGLRDYLTLMALAGVHFAGVTTEEDALRLIARQRGLNFAPGEEYLYSNSGYFLLSIIVKRASGKSLREFAEEHIFRPLGMRSTHFQDDHTRIVPRRATGYAPAPEGGFRINMSQFEQTGDGALMTTVEDLARWDANFYEPKVGGPELIRRMLTPGQLASGETIRYAAGLILGTHRGLTMIHHGGSWAGYRAEFLRFPERRFSVICLCNLSTINPTVLARQIADLYLASAFPEPAPSSERVALAERELAARVGIYRNPKTGAIVRLLQRGSTFSLEAFGSNLELRPIAKDRFQLVAPFSAELAFEESREGEASSVRFQILRPNRPAEVYEKVTPVTLSPERLLEYVGRYESEELDAVYTIAREGEALVVHARGIPASPLQHLREDEFLSLAGLHYQFRRDAQGRIVGFILNAGRARGLWFARRPPGS